MFNSFIRSLFLVLGGCLILFLSTCSPKLESWYATSEDMEVQFRAVERSKGNRLSTECYQSENYIPDTNHLDHTPVKYIRMNVHFVDGENKADSWSQEKALNYARELIKAGNANLGDNKKMWLPVGNKTPVIPTRYRYQLAIDPQMPGDSGVYRHFDNEICRYVHRGKNANLYDREVIRRYAVNLDSVLNVFIMPHDPDSVASPTYRPSIGGVALGNAIKLVGVYENDPNPWTYRGVLNHEVGHIFGLSHTWAYNDGCEDTPKHKNQCWGRTEEPPCNTLASNNMMDYNAYQDALTPCQIGRLQYRMANESARTRKVLVANWCQLQPDKDITIQDSIVWRGAKDLEGNLYIAPGGHLSIHCRVSIPAAGSITVAPGGTLFLSETSRLHNACGEQWQGIQLQKQGNEKGRLIRIGEPEIEQALNSL